MALRHLAACAALLGGPAAAPALAAPAPLTAHPPIVVPGRAGGFDWMAVDPALRRVFASHSDNGTLTVLDLRTHAVREIPTDGEVEGVAVDVADDRVFTGGANQKIVVLDRRTLARLAVIPTTGPIDDLVLDPQNDTLYADHDDGKEVWTVNPRTNALTGSIAIAGAPEYVAYDPRTDRLYQNIKPADCVDVINPHTARVVARWATAPMASPHGLALDSITGRLFSAGKNGKMVVLSLRTGRRIAAVNVATGTDQIAFDPKNRRVYCASADHGGSLSVVQETTSGVRLLGIIPTHPEAHTLAVDPATGDVWVTYMDTAHSYIQRYSLHP